MNAREQIKGEIEERQHEPGYEFEVMLLEMNQQLSNLMNDKHVRKSELAAKLGVSRAYITKLLRGESNVTLKTLVHCANALDAKVSLQLQERTASMRLEELRESSRPAARTHKGRRPAAATRSRR